jgi:hypothetical protein
MFINYQKVLHLPSKESKEKEENQTKIFSFFFKSFFRSLQQSTINNVDARKLVERLNNKISEFSNHIA